MLPVEADASCLGSSRTRRPIGVRLCAETIEELSRIPGVAGAHIMAPGNDAAIPEVIAAVRRTVTMAAGAGSVSRGC